MVAVGGNLQIQGHYIIIRYLFYIMGGAKSEQLIFRKKILDVLFHVFWVAICTRELIIALKREKKSDFHYIFTFMHLAGAFIQSDLQYIQVIHFFVSMCVP